MKKIFLLTLVCGAFVCASAEIHNKPEVLSYGHRLQYVEYQRYEIQYADTDGTFWPSEMREVTSRDTAGRVLTLNKYNYNSDSAKYTFTYEGSYSYNAAGQLTLIHEQYSSREYKNEFTYDSNGYLVRYLSRYARKNFAMEDSYREDYTVDSLGRMVTIDDYNFRYSGSVAVRNYHQMLQYNEAGQLIFAETCQEQDSEGNWIDFYATGATYDENGEIATVTSYTPNEATGNLEPHYTSTYTYNDHGDMLTEVFDYADGSTSKTTSYSYTYDEKGRMTSYIETDQRGYLTKKLYRYEDSPAALEDIETTRSYKTIENGQVVIIREGVKYNALGQQM